MIDKKQHLLETALQLFYANGVQAVGINEILKVSGVAKKTLYHHFPSKEELVLAALEFRDQRFCTWFESLIEGATSNIDLAEKMFIGLSHWFRDEVEKLDTFRGCFFINTSAEFSDADGPISAYCQAHKNRIRDIIARYMVTPDTELLDALCTLKEGSIVMAYVCNDKQAAEKAFNTVKHFSA